MKNENPTKIDYFKKLLHDAGLKATSGRLAVLHVLEENHKPLSVGLIGRSLRGHDINIVTLYRMMDTFQDKGIVRRVDLRHTHVHFELATRADHHHISCEKCGKIEDIAWCDLAPIMEKALCQSTAFAQITDHTFELFGLCQSCACKK